MEPRLNKDTKVRSMSIHEASEDIVHTHATPIESSALL